MRYELTKSEVRDLEEYLIEYDRAIDDIVNKLIELKEGTPEYIKVHKQWMTAQIRKLDAARDYTKKCQVRKFKTLGTDPAAIVTDGKELAAYILGIKIDTIKVLRADHAKDKLNEKVSAAWLINEIQRTEPLTLHYEALKDNQAALDELTGYIIDIVLSDPYTTEDIIADSSANINDIAIGQKFPLEAIKLYSFMNDKATTQLINTDGFTQEINGQLKLLWGTNQAPAKRDPVPTYISLTYEGTEELISKRLTAFDKAVYEAIATGFFYHSQNNKKQPFYITPQEVWRIMNGTVKTNKTPSANQTERVRRSLDKMRFTRFYMDINAELAAHYITLDDERIVKGLIDTYLLQAVKVEFTTDKGRKLTGYRVADEPILYSYNKAKGHLVVVPYELLDTSAGTGNEGNTIEFRNYLLQQISLMYDGSRDNNKILYSTLYRDTGIQPPKERDKSNLKKEAKKDRDKIAALLDVWTAKGWIKGYSPIRKDKSYIGVEITLDPAKKQPKRKKKDS